MNVMGPGGRVVGNALASELVRIFLQARFKLQEEGKTAIFVAIDGKPAGILAVADPIESTTLEAVRELHELGLKLVMLTGDNRRTAAVVARELGLDAVEAEIEPAGKVAHIQEAARGRKTCRHGRRWHKRRARPQRGNFLRDVTRLNQEERNFRVFGPDETVSNLLGAVFEVTNRQWDAREMKNDEFLAPAGRVLDSMLSEHQCEGWLEGYLLTGRHGLFNRCLASRLSSFSPDRWDVRCPDFPIAADNGNAKIQRSRRDNTVRHVRNIVAGHLLHRSNDIASKRRFLEYMPGVVEGGPQIIEGRWWQTVFLFDEVDDFRQADGKNLYRSAIRGGLVDEILRPR
jgi:hypothetical protein